MRKSLLYACLVLSVPASAVAQKARGEWWTVCQDDPIEDSRTCTVEIVPENWKSEGSTPVIAISQTMLLIVIGFNNSPGSDVVIRIDDNKPIRWEDGKYPRPILLKVIEQLKTGKRIVTRYTRWPYNVPLDLATKSDPESFRRAFAEAKRKIAEYHKGK